MPRNFLQRTFKNWLDKNRDEFHRRPIGVKCRNGGVDFTLQGTPNIRVYLRKYGAIVELTENGKPQGSLTHIDMREYRFEGYYLNGYSVVTDNGNEQEYFIDRITLWELDVFDKLVVWVNEELPSRLFDLVGFPQVQGHLVKTVSDGRLCLINPKDAYRQHHG